MILGASTRGRRNGRTTCARLGVLLAGVIGMTAAGPAVAEETRWEHLHARASALFQQERYIEGLVAAEAALKEAEQTFDARDFRVAESLATLAAYYRQEGRETAAETLDRRALEVQRGAMLEREIGFMMHWRYGETAAEWPAARHVILRFVDFPTHVIGIYSTDLWRHLERLRSDRVYVTFSLSYDTEGRMRRYQISRIGDVAQWQREFEYGGAETFGGASPWDVPMPASDERLADEADADTATDSGTAVDFGTAADSGAAAHSATATDE
jgi:hypothetical protein